MLVYSVFNNDRIKHLQCEELKMAYYNNNVMKVIPEKTIDL